MTSCPLEQSPADCFREHQYRIAHLKHHRESIPCNDCKYARINAIIAYVPETTIEPYRLRPDGTHTPGTKPKGACFRGHDRATYGRLQTQGRDKGGYACRECERIRRERSRKKRARDGR